MSDEGRLVAGRYRLVERIGRGGMGTVWRAEDNLLGRQVAVKKLHSPHAYMHEDELETLFERTRREARSAARISHPNVVVVHDVVDDDGLPTVVMEYVPSRTLGEVIKQDGPLSLEEAARVGRGMIAALRAAHGAGVLHRDVKPGNVLLGVDGRVVLTDFGIAQASGTSTLTRTGELIGSIDFLSPERITGGTPGPESDLWALGVTLYQAVEGRFPFHRDTPIEVVYAITTEPLPPAVNAGSLASLIHGLLAKDPGDRPSAEETERQLRLPSSEKDTGPVERGWLESAGEREGLGEAVVTPSPSVSAAHPRTDTGPGLPATTVGRSRGGRGMWAVVAVTVVVAVLAGGGTLARDFFEDSTAESPAGGQAAAPATVPTTVPTTAPTTAPATGTTTAPAAGTTVLHTPPPMPEGYRSAAEEDRGYTVPVPADWTRRASADGRDVNYIDPTGVAALKVSVLDYASSDHLQHWKEVEEQIITKVDDYQRLRMQRTAFREQDAAIWEFTFQGEQSLQRAADLGFGEAGGREYAIYLSAPSLRWDEYKPVFRHAVEGITFEERP